MTRVSSTKPETASVLLWILRLARSAVGDIASVWDRFWFTPRLPDTLSIMRIGTGGMLLYTHLVLATDLLSFVGESAWINNHTARQLHDGAFGPANWSWTYLWYINSPSMLWVHQGLTIAVTTAFMIGLLTRVTAPLAWLLQLMYLHRLTGALFGLDQIVTYSTMYLMLAPCGARFSVDAWLRRRLSVGTESKRWMQWLFPDAVPSVAANVATRVFQIHLCVIYLFGGLAKARGTSWWDGTAMWYAIANYEYQSMNLTWLGAYPRVFSALSHVTMFWETFYCALVWPKVTRPIVLAIAVAVHGGIAMFMGMITFGVMMIIANVIFVDPEWWSRRAQNDTHDEGDFKTGRKGSTTPIDEREQRVRKAAKKIKSRYARLKQREAKFKSRAEKLKEREAKVRRFVAKQRKREQKKRDRDDA